MDSTRKKNKYESQRRRKRIRYFRKLNQYKAYQNIKKHKRTLIRKDGKKSLNVNCLNNTSATQYNGEYQDDFVNGCSEYYYVSAPYQMKIKPLLNSKHEHQHKLPTRNYYELCEQWRSISSHKETTICNFKLMYKHNDSHPVIAGWNKYGKAQFVTFPQLKQMKATAHTFSGFITNDLKYIQFDDIGMNHAKLYNKKLIILDIQHPPRYTQKRVLFNVKFDEFLYCNSENILSWEDCSFPFNIRLPSVSQEIMCTRKRYLFMSGYMSICKRMYGIYIPDDIQNVLFSYFSQLAQNQLQWTGNCVIGHVNDHYLISNHCYKHTVALSQNPLQDNKEYRLKIRVLRCASNYNFIGILSCSHHSLFEYLNEHEFDRCGPWYSGSHSDLGWWSFFEFESGYYADKSNSVECGDILLLEVTVQDDWRYSMTLYKVIRGENKEETMIWKTGSFYSDKDCYFAMSFHGNHWSYLSDPAIEIWTESVKEMNQNNGN